MTADKLKLNMMGNPSLSLFPALNMLGNKAGTLFLLSPFYLHVAFITLSPMFLLKLCTQKFKNICNVFLKVCDFLCEYHFISYSVKGKTVY